MISHREYAKGTDWAIADRVALRLTSQDLLILGKAHSEAPGDPNPYLLDRPWAMRLAPSGDIVWQRMYGDTHHEGSFGGGAVLSNGSVRVVGIGSKWPGQGCRTAVLGSLTEEGLFTEGRLFCPEEFATVLHTGWFLGIQAASDGSLISWGGPSGACVCGLGTAGDLAPGCSDFDEFDESYQPTSVQPIALEILTGDSYSLNTCETSTSLTDSDGPGWSVKMCGALYPGITSVQKIQNPFRLKVTGWNFEDGCRAFVNGFEVPVTKYKGESPDGSGRRKLIIGKGPVLKALCPKGESVAITVINPDGRESVSFAYTR